MAVLIVCGMNCSLIVSQKKPSVRDLKADKKATATGESLSNELGAKGDIKQTSSQSSKTVGKPQRKTYACVLKEAAGGWEKMARRTCLMTEEKHQDVLRSAEAEKPTARERNLAREVEKMKVERITFKNTMQKLHQKLLTEVKAHVRAEEALVRARTTLRCRAAAKMEAERTASLATANLVDLQRARQDLEDGLTSHLRAWEKEREKLTSQRNQAVEALKLSEQGLTMATAKLLEVGNMAPKPVQLGVEFQTELSSLRAEIWAAQSARKTAEAKCSMTRANLITLERNLRAEIAEKDGKILVLSSDKKEALQVSQKAEQDLEAFKANLMKMASVMTRLQVNLREKDKRCHDLEKALDQVQDESRHIRKELISKCAEMEAREKQAADTAEEWLSLQKQADQSAADLKALQKQAEQSAADLEEALQKQAETRCQSQETQTEVVQSCPGPTLIFFLPIDTSLLICPVMHIGV
ncbi:myosin-9-like [Hypomesus transpacificus]|uniref:myosin-9-like n=1 Tax=Hypomesus transpacificus TaxID=137520 RepID=UPI001F0829EE|nr:myosin-9-like [Hypomesus transpacificus]